MKKQHGSKKAIPFLSGTAAMALLILTIAPVVAASSQVSYNQIGVQVFGRQKVASGETYTASNGQKVPSSITYTDAAGGKTNYLSVRQISELLDADIAWNSSANRIEIAPLRTGEAVIADTAKVNSSYSETPVYGQTVGPFEELNPDTVSARTNSPDLPVTYLQNTRVQYEHFGFPEITANVNPERGQYLQYTVTNNGEATQYVTVSRSMTISSGVREKFSTVAVKPGGTLVRTFRVSETAEPLESALCFGLFGNLADNKPTDVTVSLEQFH